MIKHLISGEELKNIYGEDKTIIPNNNSQIRDTGIYIITGTECKGNKEIIRVQQCLPTDGIVKIIKELF